MKRIFSINHRAYILNEARGSFRSEGFTKRRDMLIRSLHAPNIQKWSIDRRERIRKELEEYGEVHDHEDVVLSIHDHMYFLHCPLEFRLVAYGENPPELIDKAIHGLGIQPPYRLSHYGFLPDSLTIPNSTLLLTLASLGESQRN